MRVVPFIFIACLMAGCGQSGPFTDFDRDRMYCLDQLRPTERQTSKDAVLQIMGPPDAISVDQRAWAYHWRTYSTLGPLLTLNCWVPTREFDTTEMSKLRLHVLLLEFEADGLLARQHVWSAREGPRGLPATREILEEWQAQVKPPAAG